MSAGERAVDDGQRELALGVCERLGGTAAARRKVAEAMGVSERTVRRWQARQRQGRARSRRPGRPRLAVSRESRQEVVHALFELGPCAGVPVLRGLCRGVPYRQLRELKRRFLRVLRRRWGWYRKRLEWLRAGTTWATDFMKPRARLPDGHTRLLHVRDLGSGAELLVRPCRGERAGVVVAALTTLFLALGAPLLLKADNGGAFKGKDTRALLARHGVTALYSPPYTPEYNGACEGGGGSLKRRAAHQAHLRGSAGCWSRADLAEAQGQANTTARPWGATGPTPAERLAGRRPVQPGERRAFQRTRREHIDIMLETYEAEHGRMAPCPERASIERLATQRALCEHGYLRFRRGRLSTPIQTWKAVTIA